MDPTRPSTGPLSQELHRAAARTAATGAAAPRGAAAGENETAKRNRGSGGAAVATGHPYDGTEAGGEETSEEADVSVPGLPPRD